MGISPLMRTIKAQLDQIKAGSSYKITGVFGNKAQVSPYSGFIGGDASYDATFCGWGAVFNFRSAFNMLRIPVVAQKSTTDASLRIYEVRAEVRDSGPTGTLLAVGRTFVNPTALQSDNVDVALRDFLDSPNFMTITAAMCPSGKYFVSYRALTINGVNAIVNPVGANVTMSDFANLSYYCTAGAPAISWSPRSGNGLIAVFTYLTANIADTENYIPVNTNNASGTFNALTLPAKIWAVANKELSIFFDNLVADKAGLYDINVTCTLGQQLEKRWTGTPTAAGTTALQIDLYRNAGDILVSSASTSIVAVAASAGSGLAKTALIIGDSITAAGIYQTDLLVLFDADVMDLSMIGTQGTAPALHEGYGGRSVNWFYTDAASPFVFSGAFDFAAYMSAHSYTGVDFVIINLGVNDVFSLESDAAVTSLLTTAMTQLEAMITNVKAYSANIKFGICVPIPPNASQDAFGDDYAAGQTRWRYKRNIILWAKKIITQFSAREASNIYVIPLHVDFNTETGFPTDNAVHPNTTGHPFIAKNLYAGIKNMV